MENQDGSSSSGSKHSLSSKLVLTEENLDYFLRQEYSLSQICSDASQITLQVLDENVPNRDPVAEETTRDTFNNEAQSSDDKLDEKLVEEQEGDSNSVPFKKPVDENNTDENATDENNTNENATDENATDENTTDEIVKKSLKDIFNVDVNAAELISLFNFCQTEYGENAQYMWKEKLQEVWQTKKTVEEKSPGASAQVDLEDEVMEAGKVSRDQIYIKIKNGMSNYSSSTDNSISGNINYSVNNNTQIESMWEILSYLNQFVSKEEMEIPFSSNVNNGTYQSLSSSPQSTQIRESVGLNKAFTHTNQSNIGLIAKKSGQDFSSVRDLALASSSQDIEFIDADENSFASPMSEIYIYKTDSEDSKQLKTLSNNKASGKMLDLEDLLNTFTESTNLHIRNVNFESVIPAKSSLKRKISQISNKKNKVKESTLKFTSVTVFYFARSQGFSSVPTKGGSTLGMENQHFYISTIPIDEYEHRKVQKEHRKLRTNDVIYHRKCGTREKPKNVQALSLSQRIQLLESAEVQIESKEEIDCEHIRSSRASAGCDCKEYCDPDICCCSLSGIECQVDRLNFPCGCTKEHCKNVIGRNEYNHNKVKTHFVKTMKNIRIESKGRTSKRKQATPTKIVISNPDISRDINMIQI